MTSSTVNAVKMHPNLTACALCHDTFNVPKLLPCGHFMCRDCLVTWLQSQPQAACLLCRCVIVDPLRQKRQSVEEMADGLPTDLAMTAMVEAESLLSKQHVCCVCDDVAAVALCLQCGDMFCQQCRNVHRKQSATKHHEVEDLNSITTERLASHHPAMCPYHKEKVSELYCPTHDTSVCLLCATTTHRDCPKLVNLQSQVDEWTAELAQLSDKLTKRMAKADAWLCLVDKHEAELQKESQAALNAMWSICEQIKAATEARFCQFSSMTQKLLTDFTQKTAEFKNASIQKRSKIAAHSILVDFYKAFAKHKTFKDMVSVVKGRVPDLDTVKSLPEDLQLNQKLILTIDPRAVADVKWLISGLGMTIHTPESAPGSADPTVQQRQSRTRSHGVLSTGLQQARGTFRCSDAAYYTGLVTQFNPMTATPAPGVVLETRRQGDGWPPDITCIVTGPSCKVLYMSDNANKSIKVFSLKSNSLLSTLTLSVRPWEVALIRDNFLAVTTETARVIKLVRIILTGKAIVHTVNTARQYRGVCVLEAHSDDVTLIVSCGRDETGPASVDLVTCSMAGQRVRTLVNSKRLLDLDRPYYLHSDTRRDVLYVCDWGAKCMFRVQLSTGCVLSRIVHPFSSRPRQVCTDGQGNLYLVDTRIARVLVRSEKGVWRALLSQAELGAWPQAVCVTDTSLVISHGMPSVVQLFKMISSENTRVYL